ncbi:MAG: hypothetical protein V3T72_09000 [Thermoanaerobaculia bacterium]
MDRKPALPPTLDHVTRDVWDTCRHSLVFAGRLLDFLAFNVPGISPALDRVQLALDAVFDELHSLPESFPESLRRDRAWTRADLERALDQLVDTAGWEHPSQALDRPRPGYRTLLALCEARLEDPEAPGRDRLVEVRDKLARSVRIADEAKERRQKMTARSQKDR